MIIEFLKINITFLINVLFPFKIMKIYIIIVQEIFILTIRKMLFIHILKHRESIILNKESNNRIIKYEKRVSQKNFHHSQFEMKNNKNIYYFQLFQD